MSMPILSPKQMTVPDIWETRFMLKEAYAQGIRSVIATPHYLHRHNKMSAGQILDALEK